MDDMGVITGILAGSFAFMAIMFLIIIISFVALIFLFRKAGYVGWEALFPGYNIICQMEMAELPTVAAWLVFIPVVHIVFPIYVSYRIAKAFGASGVLCVLAAIPFTSFIAMCIIAFGKYEYVGIE